MLPLLIILGALVTVIGYALPDQYTTAASRRAPAVDKEHSELMEVIARSLF